MEKRKREREKREKSKSKGKSRNVLSKYKDQAENLNMMSMPDLQHISFYQSPVRPVTFSGMQRTLPERVENDDISDISPYSDTKKFLIDRRPETSSVCFS